MKRLIAGILMGLVILFTTGCDTQPKSYKDLLSSNSVMQHHDPSVIYVTGNFYEGSAIPFIYATTKDPSIRHYTVRITSSGGDAYGCTVMINHIAKLKRQGIKFTMIVDGKAYSAGFFLFMMGDERIMTPGSLLMIHTMEAQKVSEGKVIPEMYLPFLRYLDNNIMNQTYKVYPNVDRMLLETMLAYSGATFVNADEAVEVGLADRIEG